MSRLQADANSLSPDYFQRLIVEGLEGKKKDGGILGEEGENLQLSKKENQVQRASPMMS